MKRHSQKKNKRQPKGPREGSDLGLGRRGEKQSNSRVRAGRA